MEVANVIGVVAEEEGRFSVLLPPVVGAVVEASLKLDDSLLPLLLFEALDVEVVVETWPLAVGAAVLEVAVALLEPIELTLYEDSSDSTEPVFEACVANTVHVLVPQLVIVINVV